MFQEVRNKNIIKGQWAYVKRKAKRKGLIQRNKVNKIRTLFNKERVKNNKITKMESILKNMKKTSRSHSLDSKTSHRSELGLLSPRSLAARNDDMENTHQMPTMSPRPMDNDQKDRDQVLLKFLKDISELVRDREKKKNPPEMISDFQSVIRMQQEFDNMRDSIEGLRDQVDRRISSNLAALPLAVEPPTNFSPINKLDNNERLRDSVQKHWPSVQNKQSIFRGARQDDLSVRQFLANLTSLQKAYCLSEAEFKEQVKKGCAGAAFDFVEANLIGGTCSVRQLYTYLLHRFDRSLPPELAKRKLQTLTASRRDNLAKLLGQVLTYITQASLLIPSQFRKVWMDQEGAAAIIRALPTMSRAFAQQKLVELQATTRDIIPSLNEFGEVLTAHQEMINEDIEHHGHSGRMNMEIRELVKEEQKEIRTRSNRKEDNSVDGRGQTPKGDYDDHNEDNKTRQYQQFQRQSRPRGRQQNQFHQMNQRPYQNQFNQSNRRGAVQGNTNRIAQGQGRWFRGNPKYRPWKEDRVPQEYDSGARWCRLCGLKNHVAADQCYSMRNDDGTIARVMPCRDICTDCCDITKVGLHHPTRFCIFRPQVAKFLNKAKLDEIRKQ